jgi:hypothetical protein
MVKYKKLSLSIFLEKEMINAKKIRLLLVTFLRKIDHKQKEKETQYTLLCNRAAESTPSIDEKF